MKPAILAAGAVILVVLGLGGGVAAGMMLAPHKSGAAEPSVAKREPRPAPNADMMYDLPMLQVTLAGEQVGGHFIRLEVSLIAQDAADVSSVQTFLPRVIDALEDYLQTRSLANIKGRAGISELRTGITQVVDAEFPKGHEMTVLFRGLSVN